MKSVPPCATCKFWSPDGQHTTSGWCHHLQTLADSSDWCGEHITTMSTAAPITDAVQAAIFFAKFTDANFSEYNWACHKIQREINDVDRDQVYPQLSAAARILADEVVRLRKEPTDPFVSDCCQRQATTAGKAGSTCWWECSSCRKPCRIVFPDNNTQPL